MSLVNQETGEVFDDEAFAVSLERWAEMRVQEGVQLSDAGEPSESLKEAMDLLKQIFVAIALRETQCEKKDKQTGNYYVGWNEQKACLALGITHKQLQSSIKTFGLEEPQPDNGQDDFFPETKMRVVK